MNREIKFRAWDKERKEWGYFTLLQLQQGQASEIWTKFENWCEYTGLKDKNGKEIYEGDIVCTEYNPENHENCPKQFHDVVEYKDGAYSTFNPANGYEYGSDPNECEVLGNIYENPELL